MALKAKETKKFVSILAKGVLVMPVSEDTHGAVKRTYETSDGKTGTKYELEFSEISGKISKVAFHKGDYGKLLQITISDDGEEDVILSVPTNGKFGEDLLRKLPNVNIDEYVRIVPYSFTPKGEENAKKGVTIYQLDAFNEEEKVESFYWDKKAEKFKVMEGMPKAPQAKKNKKGEMVEPDSDAWKIYYAQLNIFMCEKIEEIFDAETTEAKADDVDGVDAEEDTKEVKGKGYTGKLAKDGKEF